MFSGMLDAMEYWKNDYSDYITYTASAGPL